MGENKKHKYRTFYQYPNNELIVWEKWIKIRNDETKNLGEKVKRPPADLVMNLLEKTREDKEEKITLENAKIEKKPTIRDKTLWEQPLRLKQACYCKPEYILQRTAVELGAPKVIEHIGAPDYIKKTEKGLQGNPERKHCDKLDREYTSYKNSRKRILQEHIKKIDPFRSELGDLIVQGSKPKPPLPKPPKLPEINIDLDDNPPSKILQGVFAIKIENSIFYKHMENTDTQLSYLDELQKDPSHEDCLSWTYYFKIPINKAGRYRMVIQNLGTMVINYCWKKITKPIPFVPEDLPNQLFFFNKNEDVIFPGQSKVIHFTFISDQPGIFNESWELSCLNVSFFDNDAKKFVVNLTADAYEYIKMIKNKIQILEHVLESKVNYDMVVEILNQCITTATAKQTQIYPYKKLFIEADLFVMKNPICFYHQTEVAKLSALYGEMTLGESWDLSITSWREEMKAKEYEDRMKYFDLLKISHSDLLKPWYEGESVYDQKRRAVNLLLGQLADMFYDEYNKIMNVYLENLQARPHTNSLLSNNIVIEEITDSNTLVKVNNIFYMHMYSHIANTIELCAGVLSSIDMNRWYRFNFCQR